jgi:hypothetical protein
MLPSTSPASAAFHKRILSVDALVRGASTSHPCQHHEHTHHAMWRPSGNGTTQETTPELGGLRRLFSSFGVQCGPERPRDRTSQTSTVPLRRPA